jgi:hypothetical protein
MEVLSAVKFSTLHNEKTIFYSHISYVDQAFEKISKLNNDVILITGNCDPSVMSFFAPDNVKYWFSQNCLVQHEKVIPIPIGLRNPFPYYIENQVPITSGAPYENGQFCQETVRSIYLSENNPPTKFLYANFNVGTNPGYRTFIKQLCEETSHINYESPLEDEGGYSNYYSKILDHESTICPIGNGLDTHRIWEVLYCKRIPITINANCYNRPKINSNFVGESPQILPQVDEYAIYTKLYSQLPVVILNSYEELLDRQHLKNLIEYQKTKQCNFNLLDFNYWKSTILNLEKTLIP